MKTLQVIVLLALVAFLFVGCSKFGSGDVGKVKNGYININKSITVGQAFDGYKFFGKKEWTAEKTDKGLRIVTFKTQVNQAYIDSINKEYKGKVGTIYEKDGLASRTITIQFTVNSDGTFKPSATKSVIILTTGKTIENSVMEFEVENIYQNKLI